MLAFSMFSFLDGTNLPQQIKAVDPAIFTNPWFLIPVIGLVGWWCYKQQWTNIIILVLLIFDWYMTGTQYMKTLVVGDQLQYNKVLPVLGVAAAQLGLVIYLLFGRGD